MPSSAAAPPPRADKGATKEIKKEVDDKQQSIDIIDMCPTPKLEHKQQDNDDIEYLEARPTNHVLSLFTNMNLMDDTSMSPSEKDVANISDTTITAADDQPATSTIAATAQALDAIADKLTEEDVLLGDPMMGDAAECALHGESLLNEDDNL